MDAILDNIQKKHAGDVLISGGQWPYNKTVQYPQTHHLVRSHKWNNIKVCPGHLGDVPNNVGPGIGEQEI